MIKSKDISVIVQGAILDETPKCLESIREHLPGAEIVLSTWEGSNVDNLDYDVLIMSPDPGAVDFEGTRPNNVNRQLVSTQNGLKVVNRKYSFKLRTDFYLGGKKFLSYWDKFPLSDKKWKCFNHRIIACTVFTRVLSDVNSAPTPFHVSDFYFFGKTEDVKSYFMNTELMPVTDMANYNCVNRIEIPYPGMTWRYSTEQYYCWSFVKQKFGEIKFDDWSDWNRVNIKQSNDFIMSNFIFLGPEESEIYSDKHGDSMGADKTILGMMNYNKFADKYADMFS